MFLLLHLILIFEKPIVMFKQISLKRFGIILMIFSVFLASCEGPTAESKEKEKSIEESIAELENELFNTNQSKLDKRKALDLVNLYVKYVNQYPDEPISPEYLFKASDISMNLNRPRKTIQLFDRILTEYPDYNKTPSALFLKAFVYEDQLQDYDNAKKYYILFLEKYPNSEFADDAEVSIKNLGKSPEELITEFKQNEQE